MSAQLLDLISAKDVLQEFSELPCATPFHSYEWLHALESHTNTKCEVAVLADGNAICPLFRKKVGPFKISFSPVFGTETAYMGVLSKDSSLDSKLEELREDVGQFFMILPPGENATFGIHEKAQTIITKLDKPSADEHFKTIEKGHRYCTNKAEKDGVQVYEDYSDQAIDTYYELLSQTYLENGYKPMAKGFYKDVIHGLHKKNCIKLLFAKHNSKVIACAAFPHTGKTVYYWTGASLKGDYAKLYPNNAIQWHLILWAYSQGFEKYDMLGAGIEGIRNFKLGWGGELADYTRIYSSSMLKTLAAAYMKLGTGLKSRIRENIKT